MLLIDGSSKRQILVFLITPGMRSLVQFKSNCVKNMNSYIFSYFIYILR